MSASDRGDLAQDRTDFAEDRTLLAHERSFASWIRTGMASVGIALGFHALFDAVDPAWVSKSIASTFLLIAIFHIHIRRTPRLSHQGPTGCAQRRRAAASAHPADGVEPDCRDAGIAGSDMGACARLTLRCDTEPVRPIPSIR